MPPGWWPGRVPFVIELKVSEGKDEGLVAAVGERVPSKATKGRCGPQFVLRTRRFIPPVRQARHRASPCGLTAHGPHARRPRSSLFFDAGGMDSDFVSFHVRRSAPTASSQNRLPRETCHARLHLDGARALGCRCDAEAMPTRWTFRGFFRGVRGWLSRRGALPSSFEAFRFAAHLRMRAERFGAWLFGMQAATVGSVGAVNRAGSPPWKGPGAFAKPKAQHGVARHGEMREPQRNGGAASNPRGGSGRAPDPSSSFASLSHLLP